MSFSPATLIKNSLPEDKLFALDSLYSYDDFSGRAVITSSIEDNTPFAIDLLVQNVSFSIAEHIQVAEHIGDTFGIVCFGKEPLILTIAAVLVDWNENYGKQYLVDTWKNKLRLEAVATTGLVPSFRFLTNVVVGPFLSMRISETSASDGLVSVAFEMLVTSLEVLGTDDAVTFDYIHGVEAAENSSLVDSATVTRSEDVDKAVSDGAGHAATPATSNEGRERAAMLGANK